MENENIHRCLKMQCCHCSVDLPELGVGGTWIISGTLALSSSAPSAALNRILLSKLVISYLKKNMSQGTFSEGGVCCGFTFLHETQRLGQCLS